MAEQWISAAEALSLVSTTTNNRLQQLALCDRANAGLIKSRARLLVVDDAKRENVDIPPRFWWAVGHEALEQDWSIGDFNRTIEIREREGYRVRTLMGMIDQRGR